MEVIKGKYVANIGIDIKIDNTLGYKFEEIQKSVRENIKVAISQLLNDELGCIGEISLVQVYADVWRENS